MQETWLSVPGTEGNYEASSLGRIRSTDRVLFLPSQWGGTRACNYHGKVLKPWPDGNGYLVVYLANRKAVNVHRLIAASFHGDGGERHVNHIDGDKTNNRPENLEWVTRGENMDHARRTGLVRDQRPIVAEPKHGGDAIRFESVSNAMRAMGASRTANIISAAKGRIPSAYGYRWKYEDELELT